MARPKHSPIDAYLRTVVDDDRRAALSELRAQLLALIPEVEECISYGMPAFRTPGGTVAGFQATKGGCSYYPFSGSTLSGLAKALGTRSRTKSAVHFTPDAPLPKALVRKLVKARLAEIALRGK